MHVIYPDVDTRGMELVTPPQLGRIGYKTIHKLYNDAIDQRLLAVDQLGKTDTLGKLMALIDAGLLTQ